MSDIVITVWTLRAAIAAVLYGVIRFSIDLIILPFSIARIVRSVRRHRNARAMDQLSETFE